MQNTKKFIVRTDFDAVLDGKEVTISFDRVTEASYDPNYGADADGNRGWLMWFIDDDRAENIQVEDENGDSIPVTEDAVARVLTYLDTYKPFVDTCDEDDYRDYDDQDEDDGVYARDEY